jgi:ribosomal protein L11 methyltransferase
VIRLAFRAPAEAAEAVLAALLELAPAGVEQVDGEGWVEYALYGASGELPAFPDGEAEVGGARVAVRGEEVADDWAECWRQFHEPVLIGEHAARASTGSPGEHAARASTGSPGGVWVRPPWATPHPEALDLVVDPGQAFGTGSHPTTRLCLELMLKLEPSGSFADLGCGSGVLAIAAAKLGFEPVLAVDNELAALEATRQNAAANGVILGAIVRHNLRETPAPTARTVAANLMRPLLLRVAELLDEPPDALILSGLLEEEADEVVAAFGPLGQHRRVSSQGWSAVLLGPSE